MEQEDLHRLVGCREIQTTNAHVQRGPSCMRIRLSPGRCVRVHARRPPAGWADAGSPTAGGAKMPCLHCHGLEARMTPDLGHGAPAGVAAVRWASCVSPTYPPPSQRRMPSILRALRALRGRNPAFRVAEMPWLDHVAHGGHGDDTFFGRRPGNSRAFYHSLGPTRKGRRYRWLSRSLPVTSEVQHSTNREFSALGRKKM